LWIIIDNTDNKLVKQRDALFRRIVAKEVGLDKEHHMVRFVETVMVYVIDCGRVRSG